MQAAHNNPRMQATHLQGCNQQRAVRREDQLADGRLQVPATQPGPSQQVEHGHIRGCALGLHFLHIANLIKIFRQVKAASITTILLSPTMARSGSSGWKHTTFAWRPLVMALDGACEGSARVLSAPACTGPLRTQDSTATSCTQLAKGIVTYRNHSGDIDGLAGCQAHRCGLCEPNHRKRVLCSAGSGILRAHVFLVAIVCILQRRLAPGG